MASHAPDDAGAAVTVLELLAPSAVIGNPTVIHSDSAVRIALFRFLPGEELPRHRSRFPVVIHILEGEAEIAFGGERVVARPGTWIRLAADLEHSVRTTHGARMLLQVFKKS